MCTPVIGDGDFCIDRSPCTCPRHRYRPGRSIKHSSNAQLNAQLDGLFWHLGQVTPPTDKACDFDHTSLEPLDAFDLHLAKDSGPFSTLLPSSDDDRFSTIPRCTGPADQLNPPAGFGANSLFGEPPFEAPDVHLNVDLSSTAYLHSLLASPPLESSAESGPDTNSDFCMDYALGSDNSDEPMLDYSTLPNHLPAHNHTHSSSLSTLPFGSDGSLTTPVPTTAPPTTTTSTCLAECRPPCIITATQNLRFLHIRQNSCLSLRNRRSSSGSQDANGPEPARMSGSVLKDNKDAGMSVCRMLQCGCALRPQNQVLLALLCSRLAVWYRAMIRACFSRRPSSSTGGKDYLDEHRSSPEKVIHQAATIGDHIIDNSSLDWDIQAQVILKELGHLQRLVDTLSARIKQAGTSNSMGPDSNTNVPSTGFPAIAHDRLVAHLSKEVEAARNDLTTAWREHQKLGTFNDKNI
ncbi:hypothetical protein N7447_007770 [Penicillium robsamsonii]|uniref:uncharacterized protein n=1 Tax=Penicillium robsamsonii TaxID=1792511 RepID=UPI002548C95D|nr:uncharacterized protein N7447_007770 [Penicillium robsamsonii]KAJ5817762.1 hypothetical protein N7447_007770 [Penicillium robsamsonii]